MSYGGGGGSGSGRIATSSDVALNNPIAGEILSYDATTQKWKNSGVDASKISSGTIGSGRIPDLSGTYVTQAAFNAAVQNAVAAMLRDSSGNAFAFNSTTGVLTIAGATGITGSTGSTGGSTSASTVSDTFTRANASGLGAATSGQTWTTPIAGWSIASNAASWAGASDGPAVINSGLSDNYVVQFTVKSLTGQYPIAIIPFGSSAMSFGKIVREQAGQFWWLDPENNGVRIQVADTTPLAANDVIAVTVTAGIVTLKVNGTQRAQWTGVTAHRTSSDTYQGVLGSGNLAVTMDDFSVASTASSSTGGSSSGGSSSTGTTHGALTRQGSLLGLGVSGAFDEGFIESPSVVWDPNTSKWFMVYTAYDANKQHGSVGSATATNLAGPWTKTGQILAGSGSGGDAAGMTGPVIYYESGTYYLYYIGLSSVGYEAGNTGIYLATATSAAGPYTRQGVKITTSAAAWRTNTVWHMNIVKKGTTYYGFINAGNNTTESIGYATATSPAGPWTVDDTNSPILQRGSGSAWDAGLIGDPYVYQLGTTWHMAYYGVNSSFAGQSDGEATTSDANFPLGWTKLGTTAILTPGAQYTYDGKAAAKPSIIIQGSTYYHFYAAQSDSGVPSIGLATATIS